MANPNFSAILDDDPADAEAPKGLPAGQYIFIVDGQPKFDKSTKKGTDYAEFTCKPVQPLDSVDQDALNEALSRKDGTSRVLADMSMRLTFYLTEDAKYRLSNFMKHCGLDIEGEKKSYSQWISELAGTQFMGTVGQTMSDDGERMYSNITKTAPVEA
jgi:hypothetical protein